MGRTKDLFNQLREEELQEEIFFNKKNIIFGELNKTGTVTTAPNIK